MTTAADMPDLQHSTLPVETLICRRSLTAQRNAGVAACADCDFIVFFDDDFLPAADYLARVEVVMQTDRSLLAVDGNVLFDGALGSGITWDDAERIIAENIEDDRTILRDQPDGLYGCNMCCRSSALVAEPFDEELPLYAWLEDYDLSRRLKRRGSIGRVMAARGVHLGVKRGRISGLRMGYSQFANPIYLARKGTMPASTLLSHLLIRPIGNILGLLRRDPYIDRLGRLRGNFLALIDSIRGRLSPSRILGL
ncbi:glycosyltransferase family 2 protein [Variibacter gotjawalensis]|uniref:glycosyltransferase family 2 protein n=1 Tax=Variibacter gotjawalensis TaxID=1333996 RepID=UPI001DA9F289|nr:GT2 family glycosyltransferase [Variibacter gotjawalensis]